jgi:hypothetical protein
VESNFLNLPDTESAAGARDSFTILAAGPFLSQPVLAPFYGYLLAQARKVVAVI